VASTSSFEKWPGAAQGTRRQPAFQCGETPCSFSRTAGGHWCNRSTGRCEARPDERARAQVRFDVPWRERWRRASRDQVGNMTARRRRIQHGSATGGLASSRRRCPRRCRDHAVPVVCFAPVWAAVATLESPASPPERPEYFADFMTALGLRYRGRGASLGALERADHPHSWAGTMEEFVSSCFRPVPSPRTTAPEWQRRASVAWPTIRKTSRRFTASASQALRHRELSCLPAGRDSPARPWCGQ